MSISSRQLELGLLPEALAKKHSPSLHCAENPHLGDLCEPSRPVKIVDEPYTRSISAGKNTYVYDAHTYHTKVPPQGIETLIDYYTNPGDVVLDPFCGSGMTGVAATGVGRKALLSDLSPAATFIAYNLNSPVDANVYLSAIGEMLASTRQLEKSLYDTHCRTCGRPVPMLYTVWSFGLLCSSCGTEVILWDVARDERPDVRESKITHEFDCPHCHRRQKKRGLKRTRRYPVLVGYKCCHSGRKESTAPPDESDLATLQRLEDDAPPSADWFPTASFPRGVNTAQAIGAGITSVDRAYTPRALTAMASLWRLASDWPDEEIRPKLLFTLTSLYQRVTVFSEFRFWGGSGNTANYNVPAIMNEQNVFAAFERKARTIALYFGHTAHANRAFEVSTQSACHLQQIDDSSVDYIFTDPPFGSNINYSEMNFLWESWLQCHTDEREEAIINKVQGKGVREYEGLLSEAFKEMHRVLKNGAWLSVVFHNSSHIIWGALQRAISSAGFVIEGTQTFDKKHGTFKQFVSENAVGYDLVMHCRKWVSHYNTAAPSLHYRASQEAIDFIRKSVQESPELYHVRFLHVGRPDEFDYRRLYANWLANALSDNQLVSLSFERFRGLVDTTLGDSRR